MGLCISDRWSSRLMEVISDLLIVGLERSVKLTHRSLNSDRFIIGPKHDSLTPERLEQILTELNFPVRYIPEVLSRLGESNQTGLGFEQLNGNATYRLYLEFFNGYKPDPSSNSGVLHVGYKWLCGNPVEMTVTRYSYTPLFHGDNHEQVVRKTLMTVNDSFVDEVVSAAERSLANIPCKHRIITSAKEDEGCRYSFDVNVYKSAKTVAFLEPELRNIARFFKIEKQLMNEFLNVTGNATLGHISSGVDAVHNPFFTVYFDDFTAIMKRKMEKENKSV